MAQRFGGKFSPGAAPDAKGTLPPAHPFDGKQPLKGAGRAQFLGISALLFLPAAFTGTPRTLMFGLAATALMLAAAFLTREGMKAHAAFDARKIARRPAFPRKIFGSVLVGAALVAGGLMSHDGLLYPLLFGLAGAALHFNTFGADPLRDKGAEGLDTFQTDRVARAVDEAEKHLTAMRDAILRANDRQLETRVDRFAAAARQLFRTVEDDPRDLTAARKYLSVYLLGARDSTIKFADLYARARDTQARSDYLALLDDLETTFADRSRSLLNDNRSDLDVEISVLRDRLKTEN
ncbi:MAG: 5-bromo-4-chloroindolyl phosphate hydrolysis family protein [Pseudotabrizicola sp.]|uniref:5-bromo-4-chloroindolyl phosphate hydrolysis family protein n=1 Tax=Pseudotabrizicola sp. TaxID=2939647 RepID=UPI0027305260|nr:5-bromo-4-chloroindolyl phosphate hydrolysis family protein [Pseudotabrizicola sp.]MDP2080735.1 5-bromo-4-chloroindolyl phosphate hydrolysis family protein [Pseudotabrizicola sp.]MDZ7574679.1 5-bromo-4-chloroindolyl phosphate hydrolysis family protein [Pseudotabrizicola sp.]